MSDGRTGTATVKDEILNMIRSKPNLKEIDDKEMIEKADKFGKHLAKARLKTSQIRRFYDEMKRIERQFNRNSVLMLKPRLAYAAGRNKSAMSDFYAVCSICIDNTSDKEDFEKFTQFIEAILAYHKFYGGED